MKHNDIPQQACPGCGYLFDAATCVDDPEAYPKPGDFSTCINCGELTVFTDTLSQRLALPDERLEMNPLLLKASRLIKERGLLHPVAEVN